MGLNLKTNANPWADWDNLSQDERDELIKNAPPPSLQAPVAMATPPPGFNLRTAEQQAAPLGDMPTGVGTDTVEAAASSAAIPFSGIGAGIGLAGQAADPKGMGMGSVIGSTASYAGMGGAVGGPVGAAIGGTIGLGLGLLNKQRNTAHANALLAARVGEAKAAGLNAAAKQEGGIRFRFGGNSSGPRFE